MMLSKVVPEDVSVIQVLYALGMLVAEGMAESPAWT